MSRAKTDWFAKVKETIRRNERSNPDFYHALSEPRDDGRYLMSVPQGVTYEAMPSGGVIKATQWMTINEVRDLQDRFNAVYRGPTIPNERR